jgi:hypothetical protein
MKSAMNSHVGQRSGEMFRESTETVKSHLDQICSTVRDQMLVNTKFVMDSISRDYRTLFGGQQLQLLQQSHVLAEDRAFKEEVSAQIEKTHEIFRKVVGALSPSPEPKVESEVEQQDPEEPEAPEARVDGSTVEAAQEIKESFCEYPVENQIKHEPDASV